MNAPERLQVVTRDSVSAVLALAAPAVALTGSQSLHFARAVAVPSGDDSLDEVAIVHHS